MSDTQAAWNLKKSGYRMTGDKTRRGNYWRSPEGKQMNFREALQDLAKKSPTPTQEEA